MSKPAGLNTLCVHAAHVPDAATGAVAEPIHLSTTFERNVDGITREATATVARAPRTVRRWKRA